MREELLAALARILGTTDGDPPGFLRTREDIYDAYLARGLSTQDVEEVESVLYELRARYLARMEEAKRSGYIDPNWIEFIVTHSAMMTAFILGVVWARQKA